jgi:hypothetical protein
MAFKAKHNITKRVEDGSLTYFFDLLDRPKSAFILDISAKLPDGSKIDSRLVFDRMTNSEKQTMESGFGTQFGWFKVEVPSETKAESFKMIFRYGLISITHKAQIVSVSARFEDVLLYEQQFYQDGTTPELD